MYLQEYLCEFYALCNQFVIYDSLEKDLISKIIEKSNQILIYTINHANSDELSLYQAQYDQIQDRLEKVGCKYNLNRFLGVYQTQ